MYLLRTRYDIIGVFQLIFLDIIYMEIFLEVKHLETHFRTSLVVKIMSLCLYWGPISHNFLD